ncbi:MAG: hypothetical protein QHI38_09060 [Armatimonadota bacterium]|nr:hypothetical protein [Armatimonadota bacterium]
MMLPRDEDGIGATWIAAIVLLGITLLVGLVLYLQMSAPLHESGNRRVGRLGAPSTAILHIRERVCAQTCSLDTAQSTALYRF